MTVKEALTTFIDIQGPISKKLLKEILPFCRALEDREKIEQFVKLGGKIYEEEIHSKNIGVIDLLTILPSLKLKADFIL